MIAFTVTGDPQTKGSAKAFKHRTTGKVIVWNDNAKCKAWGERVAWSARHAIARTRENRVVLDPLKGPVRVEATFRLTRPRTTKLAAPRLDLDKMLRAVLDALTGIVYVDDKQVVAVEARKEWAGVDGPGVVLRVEEVVP